MLWLGATEVRVPRPTARWRRRAAWTVLVIAAAAAIEPVIRSAARRPPAPTAAALARADRVTILRDRWGVPHVFGATDADAAFGLAWAHAEDDFPMIQGVVAASRGQLGLVYPGRQSLLNDGYAALIDVEGETAAGWAGLDPHLREVFEAYADGLNLYAARHPDEAVASLLPFEGTDVARGFVHKLPLMLGLPDMIRALTDGTFDAANPMPMPGSNAHAVAPWRATDGRTRLNVNSHQPWSGPVAWYEAHVRSEEGWDMAGGTFPGAPMILHGTSDALGWALTVNTPDRVDVYRLVTDDAHPDAYRFGAEWLPFERRRAWLPLETPWLTLWLPYTVRGTVHGPVVDTDRGPYAVRHVGAGQGVRAAEQWFRMNKARDLGAWRDAMAMTAIPMFNVVYADAEHVGYVYNARIPVRDAAHAGVPFDWAGVLPGDEPAALWTEVVPFAALPQVWDPASGFVQGCNSTPFRATLGPENPDPAAFPASMGIEVLLTARSMRTLEVMADGERLDREAFLALKWDRTLPDEAPMRALLLDPVSAWSPAPDEDPDVVRARELLLGWDGVFDEDDPGAAVAVLAWRELDAAGHLPEAGYDPRAGVRFAARFLREHHGRIDVPLGEVQRLVRGEVDLPLGGGPDVLNCVYHEVDEDSGRLVGDQGDSYVMIVEYDPDGARAWSVHQYGASNRPGSPHYADQAELFVARRLKPLLRDPAEIRRFLEAEYHPGEAWAPDPPADVSARLAEAEALWR
jgi:acyl-homoserine-lactone acylase